MATELRARIVTGLDDRQVQGLRQAGVDTVEKLAGADAEAVAAKAGLSADEVRRLKAAAAAFLYHPAAAARRQGPTVAYVMLALVLITVIAIFVAVKAPQAARARAASLEHKLELAAGIPAAAAQKAAKDAAESVAASDWGVAQRNLDKAGAEITTLEDIAPDKFKGMVRDARSQLSRAHEAVAAHDGDSAQRVKELADNLGRMVTARAD